MSEDSANSVGQEGGGSALNRELFVHEEVRHEETDIRVAPIVAVLATIALVFVGVAIVCWWFLRSNESDADRTAQTLRYSVPAEKLPADPRLETLDRTETTAAGVFARQLQMEHVLHSYGDTAEKGFVHIPIEQAMKLAIEAMPVRKETARPPEKGFGLVGSGESNSGRLYSEAPSWLRQK